MAQSPANPHKSSSPTVALSETDLRKRFQAIFHNTFQFMFLVDMDGIMLEMNQAATNITGIHAREAIGNALWELDCWADEAARNKLKTSIYRASGGEFVRYTSEMRNLEGASSVIDLSIKPVFGEQGDIDFFVVEGRDITNLKRLEFERDRERQYADTWQKLNEMKNEFVSQVSHELRTPLASIIGFAQTLLRSPQIAPEKAQQFLTIILDDGRRLERLVEDLLDISRIESGKTTLITQNLDVNGLLDYALHIIAPEATSKNITLERTYEAPTRFLALDHDRMTQVFVNLLSNAVKFTPKNGRVDVETVVDEKNGELHVLVRDTGVGIPQNDVPRLFEKFFRAKQRDHEGKEIRGTGLGLAIAKQIIELHGGTIGVESALGQGSTFTICLPM
ncbi:MAG: PAS domain S-box protein [Candidatus Kapaibacterium sp.]|nr:MAG: PAS domain S-box protein [Candidatus Kapabacteria bacterium]